MVGPTAMAISEPRPSQALGPCWRFMGNWTFPHWKLKLIGLLWGCAMPNPDNEPPPPRSIPSDTKPNDNGPVKEIGGIMPHKESADSALQAIDRYVIEASLPRSENGAPQDQANARPPTPSQRLQALGQHKVGTFTPLLDFQNEQPMQQSATPLLPNEF